MNDKKYLVYMHRNKANGKVYIGITCQKPGERWRHGNGYYCNGSSNRFYNAIKKYGWDGFDHIVLIDGLSEEEACRKEQALILEYKACDGNFGYNIKAGGTVGSVGLKHSEESKRKMSETRKALYQDNSFRSAHSGENAPCYGRHLTEEQKRHLSEYWKGKTFTEETRLKISKSKTGKPNPAISPLSRRVAQVLNGKTIAEYSNMHEAERATGISYKNISAVCRETRKRAGGYSWKYI